MKKITLLLFLTVSLFAQTKNDYSVIANINIGPLFPGMNSWYFTELYSDYYIISPGYSVGAGLESPALFSLYNANLSSEIDISYGQCTTGEIKYFSEKARFTLTSLPISLWAKIKTSGTIVPFVKVGIGVERTEFIEKYEWGYRYNFDIKQWFFSWGAGAGIEINAFKNITLALFVDGIMMEKGISKELDDGRVINHDLPNGLFWGGIQFGYKL